MKAGKLIVLALVVMMVAAAVVGATTVVPVVAGAVARVADGSTAAMLSRRAGFACGGSAVAVFPLPGTNAMCQSGTACGG